MKRISIIGLIGLAICSFLGIMLDREIERITRMAAGESDIERRRK